MVDPDIVGVEAAKKGMTKRVIVTMRNGERLVFDYGMLSVKKLVAAIESTLDGLPGQRVPAFDPLRGPGG